MQDPVAQTLDAVLDVLGLLAVAAGLGMAAAAVWLPLGPLAGGLTLIGGVRLAEHGSAVKTWVVRRGAWVAGLLHRDNAEGERR